MNTFDLEYLNVQRKRNILGLAFPMRLDGVGGYLTQNESLGALRDNVIQLIMTSRGSRVMRPDYGTDLRNSVFEQFDSNLENILRTQIIQVIEKYEPRVIVKSLNLISDTETGRLIIKLFITSKDDLLNGESVELIV